MQHVLERMTKSISYRGPDGDGFWIDEALGVGLGHRRLSILDLSPAGAQPMTSRSGRYAITYNGEIYNHKELRARLLATVPGLQFVGHSDTEVLLAAVEAWGVHGALERFNGMFAFALLDRDERTLLLARDRLGEKPLYYTKCGKTLLFASEIKPLERYPTWDSEVNLSSLVKYLRYSYVQGCDSIFRNVKKVPPGAGVRFDLGNLSQTIHTYWSFDDIVLRGIASPRSLNDREAAEELEALLTDAVRLRMVADVPVGAFLSGGIDSSAVVALMQTLSSQPVRTFSIGFYEKRFDEAESARAVAEFLGTQHTELYVTPADLLNTVPKLPEMFDEPFADASQIPTYLVCELARREVTVCLSGDGGDELFCGYDRYPFTQRLIRTQQLLPKVVAKSIGAALASVPVPAWDSLMWFLPERLSAGRVGDRIHKFADRLPPEGLADAYRRALSTWQDPLKILAPAVRESVACEEHIRLIDRGSDFEKMMAFDGKTYLPDDILVKVDRVSMAVSLEARVPMLDHRVAEFAWRLPMRQKRRAGTSKWLLRQVLERNVPKSLVDRPKQGFGAPIERWLREDLRDWACDLLAPASIKRDGFFDAAVVSRHLNEHLSGRRSWASQLWALLMFQAWLERGRNASLSLAK